MTENSIGLFARYLCEEDFTKSYIIQGIDSGDAARSYATVELIAKQCDAYSNSRKQKFINLWCFLGLAFLYHSSCRWRSRWHRYSIFVELLPVVVLMEQREYWVICQVQVRLRLFRSHYQYCTYEEWESMCSLETSMWMCFGGVWIGGVTGSSEHLNRALSTGNCDKYKPPILFLMYM